MTLPKNGFAENANSTLIPVESTISPDLLERAEGLRILLWQYENNRSITTPLHYVFLAGYIIVGIVAVFANGLVVLAVFRNKKVRTPRNLLIFNLAVTDLALAATIPLSAAEALSKYWPWGTQSDWLCKISRSAPTTLVFMVSVIIIVIAADRYRCIVMRTHAQMTRTFALVILPISLMVASAASTPLMLHTQLVRPEVALPKLNHVFFCMERWSHAQDVGGQDLTYRAVYSIVVAVLQYLLPLLIVLFIYFLIYKFLKEQQYPRHLRQNKTNTLLASISITHCLIWLPFSLFNILADLWPGTVFRDDPELVMTIYCAVHLIGLTSTCTNPVLYAFFNEHLRKEFEFLVECIVPSALLARSQSGSQRSQKSLRAAAGHNAAAASKKLRPRRDLSVPRGAKGQAGQDNLISVDDNDMEPTVHKESGMLELIQQQQQQQQNASSSCDCFKAVPIVPSGSNQDNHNGMEMAPV